LTRKKGWGREDSRKEWGWIEINRYIGLDSYEDW